MKIFQFGLFLMKNILVFQLIDPNFSYFFYNFRILRISCDIHIEKYKDICTVFLLSIKLNLLLANQIVAWNGNDAKHTKQGSLHTILARDDCEIFLRLLLGMVVPSARCPSQVCVLGTCYLVTVGLSVDLGLQNEQAKLTTCTVMVSFACSFHKPKSSFKPTVWY